MCVCQYLGHDTILLLLTAVRSEKASIPYSLKAPRLVVRPELSIHAIFEAMDIISCPKQRALRDIIEAFTSLRT